MRSPALSRLAGRAKACQRSGPSRSISVTAILRRRLIAPPHAVELGRDHLGVVEDERIAGQKQAGRSRIIRSAMSGAGVRIDHQQPRRVARDRRAQRDQLLRQMIVEEIGTQRRRR